MVNKPLKQLARLIFNIVKLEEEAYLIFSSFINLQKKWSTYTKTVVSLCPSAFYLISGTIYYNNAQFLYCNYYE